MFLKLHPQHRLLTMICLSFTAITVLFYLKGWLYGHAERSSRDWLLTNSSARRSPQNPRIVFLAIDENSISLDTLFADDLAKSPALQLMKQGFPFSREVYAHVINRLADAGASAVVFDLVFPGPRDGDDAFRSALERYHDKVVIGSNLVSKQEESGDSSAVSNLPSYVLPTPKLLPPLGTPSWVGFVNVHPDADDLVRRVFYRTSRLEFFGYPPTKDSEELLSLAARGLEKTGLLNHVPATHGQVMFRYAEEFRPHSLYEIFVDDQWKAPPYNRGAFFLGKIVVIGATGQSSEDRVQTPYGMMIGAQIHLNAINAALNRDFITETSTAADIAFIAAGGLTAWMLGAWVRRPLLRLLILAAAMFLYYEVAQNLANNYDILPLLLSPLIATGTSGITWSAWEQVRERVERQRTRRALERYVSKDVVREVLDNPQSYLNSLGGIRKEITVLFSDVRSFTTLTESADPHALVKQLNEYFEDMVGIVFANQGTLDKFIGDAVMAHWGSIMSQGPEIDAARAITTVLQMRRALTKLNLGWRKRGMPEMQVGFGVNYGEAIVGNLGCEAKMEVSVIGDAVNLGSRLEGATKEYHLDLCIGEKVAGLVRDQFIVRSVDLLIVKGKTKPVEIFTVLDKRGIEPPWLDRHEEAMRLYRTGDFAAAEKAWRDVLTQAPGDGLSEIFIGRCAELQAHPPTTPWTGVYEMKSK